MGNEFSTWHAALEAAFSLLVFPGLGFLLACALLFDWLDRRMVARFQGRVGPPWYQPLADLLKLMGKEDLLPEGATEWSTAALPILSLTAVLTAILYVPVGNRAALSFEGDLIVVLFMLSIPAMAYFLAGWESASIYSIIGGNRSLLQFFSYEVSFLMALGGPAILANSWSIAQIAARQARGIWVAPVLPVGFVLSIIGLIGKLHRVPFDIPKAKSEVVAGPLTEFSGRKLAMWQLSLRCEAVVGILLLVNAFLGGDSGGPLAFAAKSLAILVLLSLVSTLCARLRIDQMADLSWRVLAPLALLQTMFAIWIGSTR